MKSLFLIFLLCLATLLNANAQTSTKDLSTFLGKLQNYVAKPDGPPATMPSPDVTGYMTDPETGLRYYSKYDKIVDPVTRYSFHIGTGKIAFEPIKEKDTASNRK